MIRAFVALALPEEITARLRLLQFLLPLPAMVDPADFHLTLAFLGEQPDHILQAVHEALETLVMPPFALTLQGVGMFGGARPRVVWAGVAPQPQLDRLQAKVARAAGIAGIPVQARAFAPHVTLGRFAPPDAQAALRLERAVVGEQGFHAGPFVVDRIGLYASAPRAKGPRYDLLAQYPLA